jgi:hypothetical protein
LVASAARWWLCTLKRSWSARVMLVLLGDVVGGVAHGPASKAQVRPSNCMWSFHLAVAKLDALADAGEVGRGGHVLEAAGDDEAVVAGLDGLGGEHDGLSPEPQTLLMVLAEMVVGSPAFSGGLSRRVLAEARLQHAAHDDLVDLAFEGGDGVETALIA